MKLIFLGSTFALVYLIRQHRVIKQTYDKDYDTFRVLFLIVPCALLALIVHDKAHAKKRPIQEVGGVAVSMGELGEMGRGELSKLPCCWFRYAAICSDQYLHIIKSYDIL